jgi:hypothetical protein
MKRIDGVNLEQVASIEQGKANRIRTEATSALQNIDWELLKAHENQDVQTVLQAAAILAGKESVQGAQDLEVGEIEDERVVSVTKLTRTEGFNYDHLMEICEHAA